MDFVTHFPWTSRRHDAVWVIVDRVMKSAHFFSHADDLHYGGILQIIRARDCPVTWSANLHSIISGSQVYDAFLEELPKGDGNVIDDECRFSSTDQWSA